MKKREVKPYSKKKYITIMVTAVGLFVLAFAMLAVGAVLQENGFDDKMFVPCLIAFFVIMIVDIAFIFYHFSGLMGYEFDSKVNKINKTGYETFNAYVDDVGIYCNANKFTLQNEGYYHKKKFSFWKDCVNNYVEKVYSTDIAQTVDNQFEKIDSAEFNKNNKCYVLFIEKENITKEDLDFLLEKSSVFIAGGGYIPVAAVLVLLDSTKRCAYCVPSSGAKLSFYNYGYKLAKKILNVG